MKDNTPWTPSRKSWLIFSIITAAVIAGMCAMKTVCEGIGDSDYFWHITLGKYIVEHRSIFTTDVFSWIAAENGYTETAHSWLGSVLLYFFSRVSDDPFVGAVLYNGISSAVLCFILVYAYGEPFGSDSSKSFFLNECFSLLVSLLPLFFGFQPRPGNIGLILFLISFYLLHDAFEHMESKRWIWLPFLSILWANLHGGSVPILFAFTALFLALSVAPKFSFFGVGQMIERSKSRIARFTFILAAEIAAAMVNPYSWKLFIYFFHTNNAATKKYISEWQHAELLDIIIILALAAIILTLWLRKQDKNIELSYLLPVVATLYMSGKYVRIEPYLILCMIVFVSHELQNNIGDLFVGKMGNIKSPQLAPMLAVIAVLFIAVDGIVALGWIGDMPDRKGDPITTELTEVLDARQPNRLYTTYNYGGYLIYHGYQSFIDSRADLFPGDMLDEAIRFAGMKNFSSKDVEAYISRYNFDAILIASNDTLRCWLELSPAWQMVYSDRDILLFAPYLT